jgi:hypothetical protein
MASDKPEADPFLTLLDAKIAALQTLRDSYLKAASLGAIGQPGDDMPLSSGSLSPSHMGAPMELPTGALLGKSLPAAIKLYLSAVKKKQTIREIATALKEGGVESTAANFEGPINGALFRLKAAGDVLRFKDGWALADFYPANIRASLTKDAKPARKAAKAVRRKKKPTARNSAPKAKKAREPVQPGLEQRINAYLQTRGTEFTTVQELVNQLKVPAPVLNLMLGKMKKAGKIERNPNGLARLTKNAA